MSDDVMEAFILEGIQRYGQARETIRAFETMLEDRLLDVAKSYSSHIYTPSKSPMDKGTTGGGFGYCVWAMQEGELKDKGSVWLEFGIWWRQDEVAFYCGLVNEEGKGVPFEYKRAHPRIEYRKWPGKPRLFMLTSKDQLEGLDAEFKIVLDELLGSFG